MTDLPPEIKLVQQQADEQWDKLKAAKAVYQYEMHLWSDLKDQVRMLLLKGAIEGNAACAALLQSGQF